jgi:ferredoxin
MKISVDRVLCEAHAVCMSIDPEIFEVGEDDVMVILDEEPPADKRANLEQAVMRCPRQALSLRD